MQGRSKPGTALPGRIWLGDVEVRPDNNEIVVRGSVVRLKPKVMQVLQCLISADGAVVTRSGILDEVWPNVTVSESVVTEAIHELRRALGDEIRNARFIRTVPRRGYHTIADITVPRSGSPRIAVLPFTSLSDDPEDRYFCDGLAEELIGGLGRIRQVEVVARTSSFKLAEDESSHQRLGARLGATHLVSGSLRRTGSRIRVIAYLIDPDTQTEIWSAVFDRELGDLISVQDEIAGNIAQAVAPQLEPAAGRHLISVSTSNLEAYRQFSKGRYFWKQFNYDPGRPMEYYRHALELDPEFALPHAGMVECYNTFAVFHLMPQREAREASIEHAEQALFLDPHSADSQFAFGYMQFYMHWNLRLAEMAFNKALAINPNHVLALCFLSMLLCPLQRRCESRRYAETATRLDPLSPFSWWMRSVVGHYNRDHEDALAAAERGLALNPDDVLMRWIRADSVTRLGERAHALELIRDLDARTDEQPLFKACAGALYSLVGEESETARICERLSGSSRDSGAPFVGSLLFIHLNDFERALDCLEQAEAEKDATFWVIGCSPYFDPLRRQPRFVRLLKRLALHDR
jgi:TolB-like protein